MGKTGLELKQDSSPFPLYSAFFPLKNKPQLLLLASDNTFGLRAFLSFRLEEYRTFVNNTILEHISVLDSRQACKWEVDPCSS